MHAETRFNAALEVLPLIAILRGLQPSEAAAIGRVLYASGIRVLEVPLNSPEPLDSIASLRACLPEDAVIGAGTVLSATELPGLADAGAEVMLAPNMNPDVVRAALSRGVLPIPGIATPSEALAALAAGALHLKLFPARSLGSGYLGDLRAVLPRRIRIHAVGGVGLHNLPDWLGAGADSVGIGTALYRPGDTPEQAGARAELFVQAIAAWRLVPT